MKTSGIYQAGCGRDCPCQSRRRFGVAWRVFSTGELKGPVECGPDVRGVYLPLEVLARSKWFRFETMEVA